MNIKFDFLIKAIEEVQETNRFLDTKAGIVVVFESSILVIAISSLIDKSVIEDLFSLLNNADKGFFIFLVLCIVSFLLALVIHILLTLRIIFPQEAPEEHVDDFGFEPNRLFYLYKLSDKDVIQPSVLDYSNQLIGMNSDDIINELVYELMKLSYIRKKKRDRLAFSYKFLGILIVSLVLLGILVVFGFRQYLA